MIENEEFDWKEFTNLAVEYIDDNNPAKQRTGVSRFYYGSFCTSRDFINENKTYLNEKSKKIMTSKSVDAHGETSKIFKHHAKFKKGNKGKIISKNLNKLRKMRNQEDYDKIISKPLSQMINDSEKLSKRILELLNELN